MPKVISIDVLLCTNLITHFDIAVRKLAWKVWMLLLSVQTVSRLLCYISLSAIGISTPNCEDSHTNNNKNRCMLGSQFNMVVEYDDALIDICIADGHQFWPVWQFSTRTHTHSLQSNATYELKSRRIKKKLHFTLNFCSLKKEKHILKKYFKINVRMRTVFIFLQMYMLIHWNLSWNYFLLLIFLFHIFFFFFIVH